MPKTRRPPKLRRLRYGTVYCQLCKDPIHEGDRVAWWRIPAGTRSRVAAYCADCHHANVRHGEALR
jgi:hypothetical protein